MQDQQSETVEGGNNQNGDVMYLSRSLALSAQAGGEMLVSRSAAGVMVAGGNMQITNSGANSLVAGHDIEVLNGGGGVMVVGNTATLNQGFVGMLISQQTVLGEGSRVLLDTPQAIAFGAAVGAVFGLVTWLLRPRKNKRK